MIKAEEKFGGVKVAINCNDGLVDLMEETTAIIKAVYSKLEEMTDKQFADRMLVYIGQMAVAENDKERMKVTEDICNWLDHETEIMKQEL